MLLLLRLLFNCECKPASYGLAGHWQLNRALSLSCELQLYWWANSDRLDSRVLICLDIEHNMDLQIHVHAFVRETVMRKGFL